MAINILTPINSFVQFDVSDLVESCEFDPIHICLPVYEESDVYFQFVLNAGSEAEADALCDLDNSTVSVGIVESCADSFLVQFSEKAERFRISDTQVLYNWQHGLPAFTDAIRVGECFHVKIQVGEQTFCSNCFQRISDPCHTSVIEYGNDDNFAGFNYCNSQPVDSGAGDANCDPTIISFTGQATLTIPYTAALQAKYGNAPTVQTWIYDTDGSLVDMGIRATFDTYPPSMLNFDFGGIASGIIKLR